MRSSERFHFQLWDQFVLTEVSLYAVQQEFSKFGPTARVQPSKLSLKLSLSQTILGSQGRVPHTYQYNIKATKS